MESPKPDIVINSWYPRGVKEVIATGGSNFIGLIDENTVLKYPQLPSGEPSGLDFQDAKIHRILRQQAQNGIDVEEQILEVLGQHQRIIKFKGKHEDGLILEYMPNGSVADYFYNPNPRPSMKERLKWALQAAEAVAYVHARGVLHCDVGVGNLLRGQGSEYQIMRLSREALISRWHDSPRW